MDVRIGVTQSIKEIELDLADTDRDAVVSEITEKLAEASGTISLVDKKGRLVLIPAAKVAYVEVGAPSEDRKVGFAR